MGPGTRLNLAPGVSYSPQLFDDGDPKSSIYGQAKLQTKLRVGPGPSEALRDELTGFAGYKYARGYKSFLGDYASSDHSFSFGLTYQNALWLYCELERCAADAQGTVKGQKGLAVELTPSYSYVTSPDLTRRRHQPGALLKLSIPTRFAVTPFASVAYEHRGYTELVVPGIGKRNDDKLTLEAGIGLTRKVAPMTDIKLSVAGRFQQNWSNLAGQSYDRFYIVPGITFERSLKP